MTALLQEAFHKIAALPENLQDEVAKQLIEELKWEEQWEPTLATSQDVLEHLAMEARQEYRAGKTGV
jgi:hypothetical protein